MSIADKIEANKGDKIVSIDKVKLPLSTQFY